MKRAEEFINGSLNFLFAPDDGGNGGEVGFISGSAETTETSNTAPNTTQENGKVKVENAPAIKTSGSWRDQLSEDIKGNEQLQKFDKISDLAKAYLELGKGGVVKDDKVVNFVSGETDSDKQWNDFKDVLDKDIDPNGNISKKIVDVARKTGLSQEQVKDLYKGITEGVEANIGTAIKDAMGNCEKVLKQVWGSNFDSNVNSMKRGYTKLVGGDKDFAKALEQNGLVNNPLVAELFNRVGAYFKEPTPYLGQVNHSKENNPYSIPDFYFNK